MLKLALCGIWVAAVTGVSAYFAPTLLTSGESADGAAESKEHPLTELKTEMTSVPMIRGGEIIGYVIIQLSFQADKEVLEELKSEPQPFLVDAAFRVIFSSPQMDFRRLRTSDLDTLTRSIALEANQRIGRELVLQVLIQQLNYVRKEDIRTNWIGSKPAGQK